MTATKKPAKPKGPKGVRTYYVAKCGSHGDFIHPDGRVGTRHLFGAKRAAENAAVEHALRSHTLISTIKAVVKKRTEYEITEVPA